MANTNFQTIYLFIMAYLTTLPIIISHCTASNGKMIGE